tara:strand:- start:222 stop:392 length:171 start_codon:yes stop_codon:yes gene_type:complete
MIAIYKENGSNNLSILIPAKNCGLSITEICKKDVPTGVKYKILNISDLPDRDFMGA